MARVRTGKASRRAPRKPLAALNERHQRFIEALLLDDNATKAYAAAGYTATGNAAEKGAARLRAEPLVAAKLSEARAERAKRNDVNADWVLRRLRENVRRAMQAIPVRDKEGKPTGEYRYDGAVANGALALLGKHLGMFAEKVQHSGPDGGSIPVAVTVTRRIIRAPDAKARA